MQHYRLRRFGNVDLEFDGEIIAEDSSFEDGKNRWTEIRIYSTNTDRWVTEVKGCTNVKGEVTRLKATACATPEEVVNSFRQWSNNRKLWYYTNIALDVLDSAAECDPRLLEALKETV